MNRQILLKRGKGLLAFVIAFMMMFGMPLEVFALDVSGEECILYSGSDINDDELNELNELLKENNINITIFSGGTIVVDEIEYNGSYQIEKGKKIGTANWDENVENKLYLTLESVGEDKPNNQPIPPDDPTDDTQDNPTDNKPPTPQTPPTEETPLPTLLTGTETTPPSSSGGSHQHSFSWILSLEPTETKDGRYDYRCECGHVEASQPVSFLGAIVKKIILSIEQAPANGTVLVENQFLRCLTNEIMEVLKKRPDVTLEVKFTDQEVPYHFVIPAGQLPAEESEWYGYYYLGSVYGWKE